MKTQNTTRKSLIKKIWAAHKATAVNESDTRFFLEAMADDLASGYWNIHDAARVISEKGIALN
jgi:uncharacterized protein (DUF2164 family)